MTTMDHNKGIRVVRGSCQGSADGSYWQLHNPFGSFQKPRIDVPPSPTLSKQPATADTLNVNQNVPPPAANPSRSAISRNLSSRATSCPPFIAVLQPPAVTSLPACVTQNTHEPNNPFDHALPGQQICKGGVEIELGKEVHTSYKYLPQRTLKKELKKRGLKCGGINADLIKRLEKDDLFQAEARTVEDYNTMSPEDVHSLCVRRSLPSNGPASLLKGRLKAYDERRSGIEVPGLRYRPGILPSGSIPALPNRDSQGMLDEEALVPTGKDKPTQLTRRAEIIRQAAETVTSAMPKDDNGVKPTSSMLPGQNIHKAGDGCRKSGRDCIEGQAYLNGNRETTEAGKAAIFGQPKKHASFQPKKPTQKKRTAGHRVTSCVRCRTSKRRCTHGMNGNEHPAEALEPAVSRPADMYIQDSRGIMMRNPALAVEEAVEDLGPRTTRSDATTAKASASRSQSKIAAQTKHTVKDMKPKDDAPKSRRTPLVYQLEDEISLLQISIELKNVIAWADIPGFWRMVQDTLELKTGKPFRHVNRHIKLLIRKRCVELNAVKQRGKITNPMVSAECRPLLDEWIAGGDRVHHASPDTSITPSLDADKDTISLLQEGRQPLDSDDVLDKWIPGGDRIHQASPDTSITPSLDADKDTISLLQEGRQPLDSDDLASEFQKRSATDAWLDTSCDTMRSKRLKLCTSGLPYDRSKSSADSVGCWSLSGSSVTSESSVEDESESGGEDDVKIGA